MTSALENTHHLQMEISIQVTNRKAQSHSLATSQLLNNKVKLLALKSKRDSCISNTILSSIILSINNTTLGLYQYEALPPMDTYGSSL
jgi:hypothetical protein